MSIILKALKAVAMIVPATAGINATGLANLMGMAKRTSVAVGKGKRPWYTSRRFLSLVVGLATAAWAGYTGVEIPAEGVNIIEVAADNIVVSIGTAWTAYLQIVGQIRREKK